MSTGDDRQKIADLVHRYAQFVRNGAGGNCGDLFTEDAVFEIRQAHPAKMASAQLRGRIEGKAAIRDFIAGSTSSGVHVCPLIHNLLIEVNGHEAHGNSVLETRTWPRGHEMIGEYADSFRFDGVWLFTSRIFTIYDAPAE